MRWEDLETRLAQIYLKRAEKVMFVRGDADVDFQYVADVIDLRASRRRAARRTADAGSDGGGGMSFIQR